MGESSKVVSDGKAGRIGAMNRPIALLTDFGLSDAYVGIMKGVILSICPRARLIDITHDITPQNVRQAAYVLLTTYHYFPPDTIFLIVVDPGVGTAREPVAVETDHGLYIAPDNGVLSYVLVGLTVRHSVSLQNPIYRLSNVSQTFHGRDIFSPAAAYLSNGVPIDQFGPVQPELVRLAEPRLDIEQTRSAIQIQGEALNIDHFGNVITSIGQLTWRDETTLQLDPRFGEHTHVLPPIAASRCRVTAGSQTLTPIRSTYGAVPPGTLTPLVGSSGQLEIGMNQGSAAQALNAALGDPVTLMMASDG
jgi:S-adenosylmethionine hydrolase